MYTTRLTTQGTITLPVELRRKYAFKTGDLLTVEDAETIVIRKVPNLAFVRAQNKAHLSHKKHIPHKQGDGMTAHVQEKYGA